MNRTEIVAQLLALDGITRMQCPYNFLEIVQRVSAGRPVSAGMMRWIETVIPAAATVIGEGSVASAAALREYREAEAQREAAFQKTVGKLAAYEYMQPENAAHYLRRLHEKGLSYKAIAEAVGVSPVTVSRWLDGETELRSTVQIRLWNLIERELGISGKC